MSTTTIKDSKVARRLLGLDAIKVNILARRLFPTVGDANAPNKVYTRRMGRVAISDEEAHEIIKYYKALADSIYNILDANESIDYEQELDT